MICRGARSIPMCSRMYVAESIRSLPMTARPCSCDHVPPYFSASANSHSIQ